MRISYLNQLQVIRDAGQRKDIRVAEPTLRVDIDDVVSAELKVVDDYIVAHITHQDGTITARVLGSNPTIEA